MVNYPCKHGVTRYCRLCESENETKGLTRTEIVVKLREVERMLLGNEEIRRKVKIVLDSF